MLTSPESGRKKTRRAWAALPRWTGWAWAAPISGVVVLGVLLRFAYFDLTRHGYDQSYPAYQALRILDLGELPISGQQTSISIANPPLTSYVQAIPLLVDRSPLSVALFVAALNTLPILFTYFLTAELLDRRRALLASILVAIGPWAGFFGRATWTQGLLPFFTALAAWLLFTSLLTRDRARQRRRWWVSAIVVGLATQTFLLAYALVVQAAVVWVAFRSRLQPRMAFWGAAVVLVISAPFLATQARELSDLGRRLGEGPLRLDGEAASHAIRLVTGMEYAEVYTDDGSPTSPLRISLSTAAHYLLLAALIWGGVDALRRIRGGHDERDAWSGLLIWFGLPILMMTAHTLPVHPHYLLLTLPAGHILAAHGISRWMELRFLRAALLPALLVVTVFFGYTVTLHYRLIGSAPFEDRLEYLPIRYAAEVGDRIRRADRAYAPQLFVHAPPTEVDSWAGRLHTVESWFDAERLVVVPSGRPALYILGPDEPMGPAGRWGVELTEWDVPLGEQGKVVFWLFPRPGSPRTEDWAQNPLNLPLSNGWTLLGYDLPPRAIVGESLPLVTYWRVDTLVEERAGRYFGPFTHLLDGTGNRVSQGGGHGVPGDLWREGDTYIESTSIPLLPDLPVGPYWVATGLFDPNRDERALFVEVGGQSPYDHLLLGPVLVSAPVDSRTGPWGTAG